ncbi:MAG: putative membrane protein YeaQ/YmgE (transglycosylase-associated protein family) [Candidatus Omnitrophota bacterium]
MLAPQCKKALYKQGEGKKMEGIGYWFGFILMGGIIGWLAGFIVKGRGFGAFGDVVVGIVGAFVGSVVFTALGYATTSAMRAFIVALAGAVLLVTATRYFKRIV